jgi:predicted permease
MTSGLTRFWRRLQSAVRSGDREEDLAREIAAHLELLEDEFRRRGLSHSDARRSARRAFGGVELAKDRHRDARAFRWLDDARRDAAHATRLLQKNPLFALTASVSIALGIGGTTTIFSVANGLLFRPAPGIVEPERLVDVNRTNGRFGVNLVSYSDYLDIKERVTSLESVFAYRLELTPVNLSVAATEGAASPAEAVFGGVVSTNYFSALGVIPAAGRLFGPSDSEQLDASPFVVLSDRMWARRFNRNPSIVGQSISLNGRPFAVIGVVHEGFRGTTVLAPDLWVPIGAAPFTDKGFTARTAASVVVGARLKRGVSASQAAAEVDAVGRTLQGEYPSGTERTGLSLSTSSPIPTGLRVAAAGFLALLMGLVSVVLLIACANVAGVLLARASARRREIAVRLAMGAGRARLVRQLLTESSLLFLLGGAAGLALARGMTPLLLSLLPAVSVPIDLSIALDGRVVSFALAVSFAAAVLSGLAPALHASKADVVTALKDDVQGPSDRLRLRSAFVVAQVAFSLALVVTAGLLVSALQRTSGASQGFDSTNVEAVSLDLSLGDYSEASGFAFASELASAVRQLPFVQSSTLAAAAPGGGGLRFAVVIPGGAASDRAPYFQASGNLIAPGYFATTRIPLAAGRDFSETDRDGSAPVAIVSETAARTFWSVGRIEDALGRSLVLTGGSSVQGSASRPPAPLLVVGVARDVGGADPAVRTPALYLPLAQRHSSQVVLLTRAQNGRRVGGAIRALVATLDPKLPVMSVRALEDQQGPVVTQLRVSSAVSGGVGAVGLLLAAIGIYGVTAYSATRRTREFGIRVAMGARPIDVMRLVLSQGLSLVAIGSGLGLMLSVAVGSLLKRLIFGIPAVEPMAFVSAAALFAAVGCAACWLPAWRATRVDPLAALRSD